jgi:hypothetical protein
MDIFTTALTRVVSAPIKPARIRVKALAKEPATNELKDDLDHLENHEQYVDLFKDNSEKKEKDQHKGDISKSIENDTENKVDDLSNVITHKEEFIHPKKNQDEPDEDVHHLDLFI